MANGKGLLDSLTDVAKDLIDDMGGSAFIIIQTNTGNDAETDEPTGQTETRVPLTGNMPCIPPFPYKQSAVDGTLIKTGDLQTGISSFYLGDNIIIPKGSKMTIRTKQYFTGTITTDTYTIESIDPVYSGNSQAMVEIQLRGIV